MAANQAASKNVQPVSQRRRNGSTTPKVDPALPHLLTTRAVSRRGEGAGGPCARVVITLQNGAEVDVTRTIVSAIAHSLWEARGEDHVTNWLDAETVIDQLFTPEASPPEAPRPGRAASVRSAVEDDLLPDLLPRPSRSRRL